MRFFLTVIKIAARKQNKVDFFSPNKTKQKMTNLFEKLFKTLVLISLALCESTHCADNNKISLQSGDQANLFWTHDNQTIQFSIHFRNHAALTTQRIRFGLRSTLPNSTIQYDLIESWPNNDCTGHFGEKKCIGDKELDVNGDARVWRFDDVVDRIDERIFVLKFSRPIRLCDTYAQQSNNIHINIVDGPLNELFYSYSQQDSRVFTNRTFTRVRLLNTPSNQHQSIGCYSPPNPNAMFKSTPTDIFTHYVDLMDHGAFRAYWNVTSTDFVVEVHCKTTGWVSFGFSPDGNMNGSDIFVGWVTNVGNVKLSVSFFSFDFIR